MNSHHFHKFIKACTRKLSQFTSKSSDSWPVLAVISWSILRDLGWRSFFSFSLLDSFSRCFYPIEPFTYNVFKYTESFNVLESAKRTSVKVSWSMFLINLFPGSCLSRSRNGFKPLFRLFLLLFLCSLLVSCLSEKKNRSGFPSWGTPKKCSQSR